MVVIKCLWRKRKLWWSEGIPLDKKVFLSEKSFSAGASITMGNPVVLMFLFKLPMLGESISLGFIVACSTQTVVQVQGCGADDQRGGWQQWRLGECKDHKVCACGPTKVGLHFPKTQFTTIPKKLTLIYHRPVQIYSLARTDQKQIQIACSFTLLQYTLSLFACIRYRHHTHRRATILVSCGNYNNTQQQ